MATIAQNWGPDDMAVGGFTDEDRRRFERVDLRVDDILKGLAELKERFRDVEVDIDELRGNKADKSQLSPQTIQDHETRLRLVETAMSGINTAVQSIKVDLEPLKAWRWKQLGALGVIVAVVEFIAHQLFK